MPLPKKPDPVMAKPEHVQGEPHAAATPTSGFRSSLSRALLCVCAAPLTQNLALPVPPIFELHVNSASTRGSSSRAEGSAARAASNRPIDS